MKRLTVGSLFAGIGGFDLGLERAGFEVRWQVEIEPFARRVLAKHWPDVPRWDDVRTFPPDPVEDWAVDLVCGGFPCQSISSAGSKLGKDDERYLWPEMARVCQVLRPRWVLAENVARIITASDELGHRGGILGEVLRDLAALGYDAEWHCLPAASFGACHRRDRFWLVAWMADAATRGLQGCDKAEQCNTPTGGGRDSQPVGSGSRNVDVPDAVSERGRSRDSRWQDAIHVDARRQIVGPPRDCGWWSTQCRLGRATHGVPGGVDECGGWECGVDRVTTGQPDRVARLKGLGNAVVPQVVELIGRAILNAEAAG